MITFDVKYFRIFSLYPARLFVQTMSSDQVRRNWKQTGRKQTGINERPCRTGTNKGFSPSISISIVNSVLLLMGTKLNATSVISFLEATSFHASSTSSSHGSECSPSVVTTPTEQHC